MHYLDILSDFLRTFNDLEDIVDRERCDLSSDLFSRVCEDVIVPRLSSFGNRMVQQQLADSVSIERPSGSGVQIVFSVSRASGDILRLEVLPHKDRGVSIAGLTVLGVGANSAITDTVIRFIRRHNCLSADCVALLSNFNRSLVEYDIGSVCTSLLDSIPAEHLICSVMDMITNEKLLAKVSLQWDKNCGVPFAKAASQFASTLHNIAIDAERRGFSADISASAWWESPLMKRFKGAMLLGTSALEMSFSLDSSIGYPILSTGCASLGGYSVPGVIQLHLVPTAYDRAYCTESDGLYLPSVERIIVENTLYGNA